MRSSLTGLAGLTQGLTAEALDALNARGERLRGRLRAFPNGATAMAALELGAMEYAKGVVDNEFRHFVRDDGMLNHVGVELPAMCRILTVLALFYRYQPAAGAPGATWRPATPGTPHAKR